MHIKSRNKKIGVTIGICLFLLILFLVKPSDNPINEETEEVITEEPTNAVNLVFYDNKTSCNLNGKVYAGETMIGETIQGNLTLTQSSYYNIINSAPEISIFGRTDSCFGEDANLPFMNIWESSGLDDTSDTYFESNLNPRWPTRYAELQDFIRPEESKDYFEKEIKKYMKNKTEEDLDRIAMFGIRYREDKLLFGKDEYWQTPIETLKNKHGDCEDWATATLSLMKNYNPSIKCYNALWTTHVSILCTFNNKLIIYDQDKTKYGVGLNFGELSESEKRVRIRQMRNDYIDYWGLPPDENTLYALFDKDELITFEEDEDFVSWAINLS